METTEQTKIEIIRKDISERLENAKKMGMEEVSYVLGSIISEIDKVMTSKPIEGKQQ